MNNKSDDYLQSITVLDTGKPKYTRFVSSLITSNELHNPIKQVKHSSVSEHLNMNKKETSFIDKNTTISYENIICEELVKNNPIIYNTTSTLVEGCYEVYIKYNTIYKCIPLVYVSCMINLESIRDKKFVIKINT